MPAEEIVKNTLSLLPLLAITIPAAAAVVVLAIGDRNERLRNLTSVVSAVATFGVVLIMAIEVLGGNLLYFELGLVEIHGLSLNLSVDSMGALFALITSILWVAAMAHSSAYMSYEQKRTRFFTFMMITEAAIMGLFMVHDFFSLFIFLELMGLSAYFLVVHSETERARSAANKYLFMTIAGGLTLFMGILLFLSYYGTVDFIPPFRGAFLTYPFKAAALACMIAGFGVKAAIVPLHVWLPDAHSVAPSPASALLSGIMIKVGAYGILRTVTSFFYLPASHETETALNAGNELFENVQTLGFALILLAVASMVIGMVLAVMQEDIKRMLAYSSISQMGFILLGVGCLAYLGKEGTVGLAGSLYHIMNHAFFKACLFLGAGSILYCTHERNMFKLGGLWRKMPLTTLLWCVAALGIMGIPLFNGFVSKNLLHHAILEAQHLASEGSYLQATCLKASEVLFIIASGGTIIYFLKATYYTFFHSLSSENASHLEKIKEAPAWMLGGVGILAIGVLSAGLAPHFFLRFLIIPVVQIFNRLDPHGIENLQNLAFFSWANIKEIFWPLGLGIGGFIVGTRFWPLLHGDKEPYPAYFRLPRWASYDYWYMEGARDFKFAGFLIERVYAGARLTVFNVTKMGFVSVRFLAKIFFLLAEKPLDPVRERAIRYANLASEKVTPLIKEYSDDIAFGTLVIAFCLVILLAVTLL